MPPAAALDDVNQIRPTFEKFGRAAVAQAMRGMVRDAEQPLRGREKRAKIGTGQRENVLGADSGPPLAEIKEPASQPIVRVICGYTQTRLVTLRAGKICLESAKPDS